VNEQNGIPILFEDESLLVINKPAGVLSLSDGYDRSLPHLKTILEPDFGRLWLVHRLDRETSGVLVLARSAVAHRHLNEQFKTRQVEKIYHALLSAAPGWDTFSADFPLRKNGDRQHRTVVDPQRGKPAFTDFTVMERFAQGALIEARPHTGYTHQIRAHLRQLGCFILGDRLYGCSEPNAPIDRLALHACSLSFHHPLSNQPLTFTAPHPLDFSDALARLRASRK
jgi:RluA family pseudouridine synthase